MHSQKSIGRRIESLRHTQHDHIRRQTRELPKKPTSAPMKKRQKKREEKGLTPFPTNTSAFSAMAISTAIATYPCSPSNRTSKLLFISSHPSSTNAARSPPNHHPHPFERTYTRRREGFSDRRVCRRETICGTVGRQCWR